MSSIFYFFSQLYFINERTARVNRNKVKNVKLSRHCAFFQSLNFLTAP